MPAWDVIIRRSQILSEIRGFFEARHVTEVTTPSLYSAASFDPHLASFVVATDQGQQFLQTSPEYALKRVLAEYRQPVFEITPAFRAGDIGRNHNPEFLMLEWYRPDFSLVDLMEEVEQLLDALPEPPSLWAECRKAGIPKVSFQQIFIETFNEKPDDLSSAALWEMVRSEDVDVEHLVFIDDSLFKSDCLDFLFKQVLEPTLPPVYFLTEFPICQSALAVIDNDRQTASRFELYWQGVELANGYEELRDVVEINHRGALANEQRKRRGLSDIEIDQAFVNASARMPACAGVALGFDRLLMVWLEKHQLAEVQLSL